METLGEKPVVDDDQGSGDVEVKPQTIVFSKAQRYVDRYRLGERVVNVLTTRAPQCGNTLKHGHIINCH